MEIEKVVLDEIFYLKFKLPDYVFTSIKNEVAEMVENKFENALPYNYSLAGAIQHEYILFKNAELIDDFFSHDRFHINGKRLRLARSQSKTKSGDYIPSLWVNFQQKHEYNPLHNHDGDFSFVTWVNIPYSLEEERSLPSSKSGTVATGPAFTFLYSPVFAKPNFHVAAHRIPVDKSYEGTCILFKSWLQHDVSPFYTSDDYRISVSGNFDLV